MGLVCGGARVLLCGLAAVLAQAASEGRTGLQVAASGVQVLWPGGPGIVVRSGGLALAQG